MTRAVQTSATQLHSSQPLTHNTRVNRQCVRSKFQSLTIIRWRITFKNDPEVLHESLSTVVQNPPPPTYCFWKYVVSNLLLDAFPVIRKSRLTILLEL